MTLPGAPCIYYGDEIGMEGREDPDCRRAYPWDPARQDGQLRAFVAGLIALRKSEPALRRGRFRLLQATGSPEGSAEGSAGSSAVAYALDQEDFADAEGESSRGAGGSDVSRPAAGRPVETRPVGRSIIVAVNAADTPSRIRFGAPGLTGFRVEQVSWPGNEWTATFAPTTIRDEVLEIGMEARSGVVLRTGPNL